MLIALAITQGTVQLIAGIGAVLLIVLAIRPWGLFGSREQLDRV